MAGKVKIICAVMGTTLTGIFPAALNASPICNFHLKSGVLVESQSLSLKDLVEDPEQQDALYDASGCSLILTGRVDTSKFPPREDTQGHLLIKLPALEIQKQLAEDFKDVDFLIHGQSIDLKWSRTQLKTESLGQLILDHIHQTWEDEKVELTAFEVRSLPLTALVGQISDYQIEIASYDATVTQDQRQRLLLQSRPLVVHLTHKLNKSWSQTLEINGLFRMRVLLPVTKKAMARGEAIKRSDLHWDWVASHFTESTFYDLARNLEDVEGFIVKRPLKFGESISLSSVDRPRAVKRGDIVSLALKRGNLAIQTQAKALQDGYEGDWIQAQQLSTKKVIQAQVKGERMLEWDL